MKHTGFRSTLALLMLFLVFPFAASAQLMVIGNDEKVTWDDAGKQVFMGPGKDTVSIVRHLRSRIAADHHQPAAHQLDLRPTHEPGHHPG